MELEGWSLELGRGILRDDCRALVCGDLGEVQQLKQVEVLGGF